MPINSLENAQRYSEQLDLLYQQKSVTGFFADNIMRAKFVGAKTVLIPDVDFQGLADYDRDTGFTRGAITVANTSFTMAMDRARSLQIDREDLDETGVANLAGKIMGEYVRTKVVPESDAYILSKLAGLAATRGNTIDGDVTKPFETFNNLVNEVRNAVGYDEELVAFIDSKMYAAFQNSSEISKMITVSDFKQGEVNLKVRSINGVSLIPVVPERMKTAYTFNSGSGNEGGFTPLSTAKEIYMLVLPKSGAHLVKKTDTMRIFTPEQNLDADAYKFDYRIYYDVFVKKSGLEAIWAWLSTAVTISAQPSDVSKTEGSISGSLSVTATAADSSTLKYQWYEAESVTGKNRKKIIGATSNSFTIPTTLTADDGDDGKYYYYCEITVNGMATKKTAVATVTISAAS